MSLRPDDTYVDDGAREAAVAWFARWRSGQMTKSQIETMEAWLRSAPENAEALEEIARVWDGVEAARRDPGIMALREKAKRDARRGQATTIFRRAAAIVVFVAVGLAGGLWYAGTSGPTTYATRLGEQSTVHLRDGSKVTLDTDSEVRIWRTTSRRRLELVRGRAFFEVAKDARHPFVVGTSSGSVTAVGTAFDVRSDAGGMRVVLVEGRVRIEPAELPNKAVEMTAGHAFIGDRHGWRLAKVDTLAEASWVTGRLVFHEEQLSVIAEELNRYSPDRITIADPAIGWRRLSAVLKSGDTEAFVKSVELLNVATVVRTGPHEIRLVGQD